MRVLIIENDANLAFGIKAELKKSYVVDLAENGENGAFLAQTNNYDVILVDIVLPDIHGIEICRIIRSAGSKTPILMLTGITDVNFKVSSLDSGADDYLTKPFSFSELSARMRALMRRGPEVLASEKLRIEDLVVDLGSRTVKRAQRKIYLRKKEFDFLELLLRNKGKVVSKEKALESIWEEGLDVLSNTLEVHIRNLRKAIDTPDRKKLIKTVHGIGYKIE